MRCQASAAWSLEWSALKRFARRQLGDDRVADRFLGEDAGVGPLRKFAPLPAIERNRCMVVSDDGRGRRAAGKS